MHALIFGIFGALLGWLIAQLGAGAVLRRSALALATIVGLVAICVANAMLANSIFPGLMGNPTLGGGVYLLGLWYFYRQGATPQVNRDDDG